MDAIQNAPASGNISFDSGCFYTMSDKIIKKLAERSDVVTEITFEYQNVPYKMTIPAGVDYTAILGFFVGKSLDKRNSVHISQI